MIHLSTLHSFSNPISTLWHAFAGSNIDTHAFVVTVDTSVEDDNAGNPTSLITTSDSPSPPRFIRTIRDALSMPSDEALDRFLPWCEAKARALFKGELDDDDDGRINLEPGSKMIRILIQDDSLPDPMSTLCRPAVIKPEDTASAPPQANDEAMWRPILDIMIRSNDR